MIYDDIDICIFKVVCACIDVYRRYIYIHRPCILSPISFGSLKNLKLLRDFKSSTPCGKLFFVQVFGASKCD